MFIKEIEIEGFMPFRDKHKEEFHRDQIIGITGQYGDDFSKSNRAGKSSFVDAIVWALYGKSRAKKDVELVHQGNDHALVSLVLDNGTRITRTRTADNKGTLEVSGVEGSKKKVSQAEVDKIVGMNHEEFEFTAFFKQNDIDQFMTADPQKKKSILMRWLQTNNWSVYEEATKQFKKTLTDKRIHIKGQLEGLPEESVDVNELRKEIEGITNKKKAHQADLDKIADGKVQIELQLRELKTIDEKKERVVNLDTKIQQLRGSRPDSSSYAEKIKQLDEHISKYPKINDTKLDEANKKREQVVSGLGGIGVEERNIRDQIHTLENNMTGHCPYLDEPCSRIEKDPMRVEELENNIRSLGQKRKRYEEIRDKCDRIIKLAQAQQKWEQQKETFLTKTRDAKAIEKQIADLSNEKSEIQKSIPHDVEQKVMDLSGSLDRLADDETTLQEKIGSIDSRLGEIGELMKQDKIREERLAAYTKDLQNVEQQLADVQYVEYMFGKNGIPSMELENSFQEVENDANIILKSLRAPFHLEFEATRELKEWEPNCLACGLPYEKGTKTHVCRECKTPREKKKRDELSLKVFEGERERQFYMDSGGGKVLLSVGIRLALTQLARRRKGSTWGTIFLDEVFGQLDATNRRLMADLITSTLLKDLGFEQVFIISHDPSIQSSMADQLIVRRHQEQGYSELYMN